MLSKKILSLGLVSLLSASLLVGCGSEFDSTEYLDEQGKQLIKKYEDREKYDYIKVEELDYLNRYEDEYIMITGKVTDIDKNADNGNSYSISFDFEENHTTAFIKVFINKNMIDVKFNKGDIITVYGKCYGIRTKRYDDKSFDYWHINAYFLELGDTTNEDINTKDTAIKEITDNKDVATEIQPQKKVTVNVSEQATDKPDSTPKEDSKKSYQKDTNQKETKSTQKKSNENTTKEEPVYDEYGYDQNGNYDPNKDLYNDREWNDDDYERWDDIYGDENKPEQMPSDVDVDDNIDPETGLAKIKGGTHLGEEADDVE